MAPIRPFLFTFPKTIPLHRSLSYSIPHPSSTNKTAGVGLYLLLGGFLLTSAGLCAADASAPAKPSDGALVTKEKNHHGPHKAESLTKWEQRRLLK